MNSFDPCKIMNNILDYGQYDDSSDNYQRINDYIENYNEKISKDLNRKKSVKKFDLDKYNELKEYNKVLEQQESHHDENQMWNFDKIITHLGPFK